jgi:RNA polymerase sigma-70 factor (ECF subfamily)
MQLYLEKRPDLVRFFAVRTGSASDAEDIVQDIWIKISSIGDGEIDSPSAYLYRLGSNVMLDRARSDKRSRARDDNYYRMQLVRSTTTGEDEAAIPTPEQAVASRQRLARLIELVRKMPDQRRRVFTLHKLDGLSYGDVARRLGISRSAVEKHMMAALRQIAELRE